MDINEFFTNTFFTVVIGLSALFATVIYINLAKDKIAYNFYRTVMKLKIQNLKNHYIILGFGRVGSNVAKELEAEKANFVVIDRDRERVNKCEDKRFLCIHGNVTENDRLLKLAKLDEAKAVIICFGEDSDNIAAAISIKALKNDAFIVARANTPETVDKLNKLGVSRVVQPNQIGGYHMATMALRPGVIDFLDVIIDSKRDDLQIEEIVLNKESALVGGRVLDFFNTPNRPVLLLALRKSDGELLIKPAGSTKLSAGDKLIVMGSKPALLSFAKSYS